MEIASSPFAVFHSSACCRCFDHAQLAGRRLRLNHSPTPREKEQVRREKDDVIHLEGFRRVPQRSDRTAPRRPHNKVGSPQRLQAAEMGFINEIVKNIAPILYFSTIPSRQTPY
jgi:hypothetical protein